MKHLFTFVAAISICVTTAFATDITLPRKPALTDIPKRNHLGETNGRIWFYATSVTRIADGTIVVMYGYIMARINGTSSFYYWNDVLDMECHGTTRKLASGVGGGDIICTHEGRVVLQDSVLIPAKKYMRMNGAMTHKNTDLNGTVVWTALQWKAFGGFPNAQPLIDAFR